MRSSLLWLVGVVLLVGCGEAVKSPSGARSDMKAKDKKEMAAAQAPVARRPAAPEPAGKPPPPADEKKQEEPRKLIKTGQEELIVEDFDQARADLDSLLKEYGGYVSRSDLIGEPGQPRSGSWTLRIPTANFTAFLDATRKLGEMRRQHVDSEDVTDQYYDAKVAVKNLEAEEEAFRQLYKEKAASSKITEILEVRREVNRVRREINQLQGQLQRWDKLVEYSTLTLTIRDRKGYVPPESPEFGTSIGRTFFNSIDALVWVGQGLVIAAVAVAPWFAVVAVLVVIGWIPGRYFVRRRRGPPLLEALPPEPRPQT